MTAKNQDRRRARFDHGGYLAIDPKAMFEWFDEDAAADNQDQGKVAVVSIRGPLVRAGSWWCDSYESISARLKSALDGPAESVVLRIDSPGGDAMGCFEAVNAARAAVKASEKRVIAYVDGRACSAAYAWACVAGEIVVPPSGEAGSVGVISCRLDATEAARKDGYRLEITASGKRKAWGHPQTKSTPEERADEQRTVDDLAAQFFAIVSEAREMSVDSVDALEAGTFLGSRAVDAGLADRVETLDALLASLAGSDENMKLEEIIAGLKAAAAGNGPDAVKAAAALAQFNAEAPSKDKDEEDSAEDKDEEDSAEDKDEEDSAEDEDEEDSAEDEDEEDSAEDEDEKDKAKAARKGKAAVSTKTAQSLARSGDKLAKRLARLEAERENDRRAALLDARPDISKELRKTLAGKPVADVKAILAGIPKPKRAKPAASDTPPATLAGKPGDGHARLSGAAADALKIKMGLAATQSQGVQRTSHTLVLGAPVVVPVNAPKGA